MDQAAPNCWYRSEVTLRAERMSSDFSSRPRLRPANWSAPAGSSAMVPTTRAPVWACTSMSLTWPESLAALFVSATRTTPISGRPRLDAPRDPPCSLLDSAAARSRTRAMASGSVRERRRTREACGNSSVAGESPLIRPQSAMTSAGAFGESAREANARPSVGHRPASPAACSEMPSPTRTSRPPLSGCTWSQSWSGTRPRRAVAAIDSMPVFGFSGPPCAAADRYTRSPPAGSASASRTRRGQTAARATAAVVTPGEPLSAARAMRAMASSSPSTWRECARGRPRPRPRPTRERPRRLRRRGG